MSECPKVHFVTLRFIYLYLYSIKYFLRYQHSPKTFRTTLVVLVKLTEWPPVGKIAAHSAYDKFHGIST